ncbi:MAG: hypothetical protein LBN42_00115 [Oscillospiraceae bacterium]|jgi:Na+-transporting NADH:ubiquinone oxidoreductase subunit NqrD|nr:hypothetical protein [Oscillospiraceae bacterium]
MNNIFSSNYAFQIGIFTALIVGGAERYRPATLIATAVLILFFPIVGAARAIPSKLPYAVRKIILYAVSAGLYIPVYFLLERLFPTPTIAEVGIYLPLVAVAIPSAAERREKVYDAFTAIIGFCAITLVFGALREYIAYGTIEEIRLISPITSETAAETAGGFILFALCAAAFIPRKKEEQNER